MVSTEDGPKVVFIAGYTDLTDREFLAHYLQDLREAIDSNDSFVLSDEPGTCLRAYDYLLSQKVSPNKIAIYMSAVDQMAVYLSDARLVHRIEGGEYERYAEMARVSDRRIIWLRPGDTLDDHGCVTAADAMDMRFLGPKEAERAVVSKHMFEAMEFYDTIV